MKVVRTLAFAGLTMAGAAQAADLFGSAPPLTTPASQAPTAIEIGSSWYIRGDIGVSFDNMPTVTLSGVALPAPNFFSSAASAFGSSGSSTTGWDGSLGFGYRYNDYLRFDATWDYRAGPGKTLQGLVVCPYGLTVVNNPVTLLPAGYLYDTTNTCDGYLSFKEHNNTFLANAYVDLGTYAGFTPYVGGGVGMNVNSLQGSLNFWETANAQPYAANLTPINGIPPIPQTWVNAAGQTIVPQPPILFAAQNWNRTFSSTAYRVAWALTAGIGFQLNPSATLDISYRYLNGGESSVLLNPQTGLTVKQNNSSQQVRVGVRYVLQ
jgi:opacity protein-like surface antigen